MATAAEITPPYPIAQDDPLADAHALVSAWVEAAVRSYSVPIYHRNVDLKSLPEGRVLLAAEPATARRLVLAAVEQVRHWDDRHQARAYQAVAAINSLLRRSLPFTPADGLFLARWCTRGGADLDPVDAATLHLSPARRVVPAIVSCFEAAQVDHEGNEVLAQLAQMLRYHHSKEIRGLGTKITGLLATATSKPDRTETTIGLSNQLPPKPAPAGDPRVLVTLKKYLGIPVGGESTGEPVGEVPLIGKDRFPLRADSPLAVEHGWLSELLATFDVEDRYAPVRLTGTRIGEFLRHQDPATVGRVVLAAAERQIRILLNIGSATGDDEQHLAWELATKLIGPLAQLPFEVDRAGLFDLLLFLAVRGHGSLSRPSVSSLGLMGRVEAEVRASGIPLTEGERYVLALFRAEEVSGSPPGRVPEVVAVATRLIGDGAGFFLTPGESWADAVNADLTPLPPERRAAWVALLAHASGSSATRPAAQWLAEAGRRVAAVGPAEVAQALERWLPLVARGRSTRLVPSDRWNHRSGDLMDEGNAAVLKGLLWIAPTLLDPGGLARGVGSVAASAYRKVPGIGPRAIKVGNAAVAALAGIGTPGAVGQLALLKVRVKFGGAQREVAKAFDATAQALGLPRDEIEELGVPSYGLEEVGRRSENLGGCRAELTVDGTDALLRWFDGKGKAVKSVPAAVKRDHKDEVKELQDAAKDIAAMLPAQRDRIDGLFLLRRSWPIEAWRERYADHPLVGTIARRLIWRVDGTATLWHDGTPTDVAGAPVPLGADSEVTCWHPVECPTAEVLAWRERLEALKVRQPFKQAHREVYLLTDAERRTATYSNRFAGHVVRQHQFNALAAARGWRSRLRMMVDDSCEPPSKDLAPWGLRAEYWVEGAGDQYGADTNEAGAYLRLATDQVRFYRLDAAANSAHVSGGRYESQGHGPGADTRNEPVPIDQIPALVLSEVMRDVDLFVGVGSVGNDPTWQDGGPGGRYRDYWQGYSFGELSGTAGTRKAVLERLVPRLKIGKRCSFTDRFLRVEGSKRAYKIHLGSGNILMEPNDQYLCIVPDARARASSIGDLFLPFEGDAMLSIILSKAFLLADDAKITDPTITRQIDGR